MKTKKKLLFVINSLGRGGAEKALIELLNVLDPERYEVSLYLMVNRGEFYRQLPSAVKVLNRRPDPGSILNFSGRMACLRAVAVSSLRRLSLLRNLPYLAKNSKLTAKGAVYSRRSLLSWKVLSDGAPRLSEEYDLAVAFLEGAATYYVAEHVKAKHKAAFVHINFADSGYTKELDHGCYDRFEKIFVVSEGVRESFLQVHPEQEAKVHVFHNIINVRLIREKAEGPGFDDDFSGMRLLTLGRLHTQKAYEIALQALQRVLQDGYPVRWYVLGDGPERENLERLRARLGLEQDFVMLGSRENPYPYVREADLYVHVTRTEGKSVAIEEAQVLHKPILASDIPGNREQIVSGRDGELVELDAGSVAKAIERLLDHPELRRAYAEETKKKAFDYEEGLNGFLGLMEESEDA